MTISNLKIIFSFFFISFLTACSSTNYNVNRINGDVLKVEDHVASEKSILLSGKSIYLVNGGNGSTLTLLSGGEHNEVVDGSGLSALTIAYDILRPYSPALVKQEKIILEDRALEIAATNKNDYLLYSKVEYWSDPFGMACNQNYYDEASVLLSLYSVKDKELINTYRLSASSCPSKLNGIPLSSGSPEKLYKELFTLWIDKNLKD